MPPAPDLLELGSGPEKAWPHGPPGVPDTEPSPRLWAPGTFLRPSLAAISSTTSAFGSSRSSKLFCVPICRGSKGRRGLRGAGVEKQRGGPGTQVPPEEARKWPPPRP